MPRIRRQNLPRDLWAHLLERNKSRYISVEQLGLLAGWLGAEPEVPDGRWFKRFPGMIVCGEGELIRTFLQAGQAAMGEELKCLVGRCLRWTRWKVPKNRHLTATGALATILP